MHSRTFQPSRYVRHATFRARLIEDSNYRPSQVISKAGPSSPSFRTLGMLVLLLLLPAYAGCLNTPAPSDGFVREGDEYSYRISSMSSTFDMSFQGTVSFEVGRTQSNPEDGRSTNTVEAFYHAHWEGDDAAPRDPVSIVLSHESLNQIQTSSTLEALGVTHESVSFAPPFSGSRGVLFDFEMFPPRATAEDWLTGAKEDSLRRESGLRSLTYRGQEEAGGFVQLTGIVEWVGVGHAGDWRSTYSSAAPVPTSFEVQIVRSTPAHPADQRPETFSVVGELMSYKPGRGAPLATDSSHLGHSPSRTQAPLEQTDPSEPGDWTSIASGMDSLFGLALGEAWNLSDEHVPRHRAFVSEHNLLFPSSLLYRAIHRAESRVYEWNITHCTTAGDCSSSVVGLLYEPGGEAHGYGRDEEGHPDSGGLFGQPNGIAPSTATSYYEVAGIQEAARQFSDHTGLPIVSLSLTPRTMSQGSESSELGSGLTQVKIAHGEIHQEQHKHAPSFRTLTNTVSSVSWADSGKPVVLRIPEQEVPPSWRFTSQP